MTDEVDISDVCRILYFEIMEKVPDNMTESLFMMLPELQQALDSVQNDA